MRDIEKCRESSTEQGGYLPELNLQSASSVESELLLLDEAPLSFKLGVDSIFASFPGWTAFNPRFSAVYDLRGDGRTAVKFVANRYIHPVGTSVVSRVNPLRQVNDTRRWTACAPGQTSACDLNRDLIPQFDELGPSSGFDFGNRNRYADGYAWPHSNEYTIEIQRQLPADLVVTLGLSRRERRGELGSRNVAVPPETYLALSVREVNSGETVTVYNQNPAWSDRHVVEQ